MGNCAKKKKKTETKNKVTSLTLWPKLLLKKASEGSRWFSNAEQGRSRCSAARGHDLPGERAGRPATGRLTAKGQVTAAERTRNAHWENTRPGDAGRGHPRPAASGPRAALVPPDPSPPPEAQGPLAPPSAPKEGTPEQVLPLLLGTPGTSPGQSVCLQAANCRLHHVGFRHQMRRRGAGGGRPPLGVSDSTLCPRPLQHDQKRGPRAPRNHVWEGLAEGW